jgi:N6-adenosine-specific RNA methylase IME4
MKYSIIYADPPWEVKAGPPWSSSGKSGDLPYPTMKLKDIKSLKVKEIADKNSHLYLWTINKYVDESYDVARDWGFKPVSLLTWCKPKHGLGLGGSFVQTSEHLLLAKRGNLPTNSRVDSSWFFHKRLKHSEKPQLFRDLILKASGNLPRIELFARQKTEGWDVWGNEVESDIKLKVKEESALK